jgi:hypothetical protein
VKVSLLAQAFCPANANTGLLPTAGCLAFPFTLVFAVAFFVTPVLAAVLFAFATGSFFAMLLFSSQSDGYV